MYLIVTDEKHGRFLNYFDQFCPRSKQTEQLEYSDVSNYFVGA